MKKMLLIVLAIVFIISLPVMTIAEGVLCIKDKDNDLVNVKYSASGVCDKHWISLSLPKGDKGDKGDTGATGVGIQGIAGTQGIQGIPGISLDLSKLYIVTSHHAPGICNNDDVAISCTSECSTHPDYTNPPYPFPAPFYGVPEEVISIAFGINFATESAYAYEDHQPGVCVSKCIVPPGTMGTPPGMQTYNANVRVLCMSRD